MARLSAPRHTGMQTKLAYWFTRRLLTKMAGRSLDTMLEPVDMLAHLPAILTRYGALEGAVGEQHLVSKRYQVLAELKAATLTHCEYCIDIGSHAARQSGITDEELLALPGYRTAKVFDDVDRLVLDYSVAMSATPVDVPDELFDRLRAQFDDAQIVELTFLIALENLRGRFNLALGIGAAGFTEGMVCAVPAAVASGDPAARDAVRGIA